MALLLVLFLGLGGVLVVWGLRWMWWGTRFAKGHSVPDGFRVPGRLAGHPRRLGFGLLLYGMVVMGCGNFAIINAAAALLAGPEDELPVMGETLRLFSSSTSPWLDVAKGVAVTSLAAGVYLWAHARRGAREGPAAGASADEGQSRSTGRLMVAVGTLVCLLTVGTCVYLTAEVGFGDGAEGPLLIVTPPVVLFLSPAVYLAGLNLRRKGRRHLTPTLASPDELADGSYVLYLRSFTDDAAFDRPQQREGSPALHHFLISGRSEEEQLAAALRKLGPLVAVGEPGETLPYVGARRLYLPPDDWQDTVRDLMLRARLVVLSLGPGDGTMWELVEAMRILPPERLVLVVPMDREAYEEFRAKAGERLRELPHRRPLPPYTPDPRQKSSNTRARIKAVVHYGPEATGTGWRPYFVWLDAELIPLLRFAEFRDKLYVALKHGLRPVVDSLTTGKRKTGQKLHSLNVTGRIALVLAVGAVVVSVASQCGTGAG